MEYIYATLLLHKLGKEISEENLKKVIEAAGAEVDEAKIKTLITSLKNVDIAKELETATIVVPATQATGEVKAEKKKEEKAEEAVEGLSSLFG